jgi:hypothetical protein
MMLKSFMSNLLKEKINICSYENFVTWQYFYYSLATPTLQGDEASVTATPFLLELLVFFVLLFAYLFHCSGALNKQKGIHLHFYHLSRIYPTNIFVSPVI